MTIPRTTVKVDDRLGNVLSTLMRELAHGSPDPRAETSMLNRGDEGLLRSLEQLSAAEASKASDGGASIAAHADHLRYGYSILNRWANGEATPWATADWTQSWNIVVADDEQWKALVAELRREINDWLDSLRTPREVEDADALWLIGNIAHLAYHLGAIRQIDRATRGPTAEDERRAKMM
ncbi:MAG TPA: hypothetical protein VN706_24000 [Gemmatimonadaceae bacterium]|nr:hypothetical protein [Gemmatimonadaceae bacterium]